MPASLRWRLAGWVALVVVISFGITFLAVYRGTGTQLHRQIDREIAGDVGELTDALAASHPRTPQEVLAAARDYVGGRPFNASSTVLFVLVPRAGTATNTPELFGNPPPDDGESLATQEQENRLAHRLLTVGTGFSTLEMPDIGYLRLLKRQIDITGAASHVGQLVTVGVGEPVASVARAQRGVARAFILAGFIALAGALLASLLIGTRFSRPLRRMAAVAAQVDAGDLHPRIHYVARESREVQVLADAFNHMLDRLTDAFAGQRAFIADASHELRTPLTVIRGQLEVLAAQRQPSGEEVRRVERLVQSEVARVTRLVDDLLLLVKAEQTRFLRLQPVDLESFVGELWAGVTLLAETGIRAAGECPPASVETGMLAERGMLAGGECLPASVAGECPPASVETGMLAERGMLAGGECLPASVAGECPPASVETGTGDDPPASVERRFELGEVPAGTLIADPDRLAQALRNLIGNAIEHTRAGDRGPGLVRMDIERPARGGGAGQDEWVCFVVQDDGPGIPAAQRERIFDRFHRTDAARDRASGGTGLGLAIVRAIAEAHGGRVTATESSAGGARIELELPRFAPAGSSRPIPAEAVYAASTSSSARSAR
jgi:two-component system OmpR family sensor kinase